MSDPADAPSPRILVLLGHPDPQSFNAALAAAYVRGAESAGAAVERIDLHALDFDPILRHGYRRRMELEPDLVRARASIERADHLAVVHPVWWGGTPALLQGFLDRALLPGFAFRKRPGSLFHDPLLTGRTGRVIATMDQPAWFYRLRYGAPSRAALEGLTLRYIGIRPFRPLLLGPLRLSSDARRARWLERVERVGASDARRAAGRPSARPADGEGEPASADAAT